jgi:hypothetical protein
MSAAGSGNPEREESMPQKVNEIERKIYFYWVNAGRERTTGSRRHLDIRELLVRVNQLPPTDDGLYEPIRGTGDHNLAVVDDLGQVPKVRWVRSRYGDLPESERRGKFGAIELAEDAGIAYKCHLVFFPDGVVGADSNNRAPSVPAFARYLIKKVDAPPFAIENMISRDALRRLDAMDAIHLLDLRVTDPQLHVLDETPFYPSFRGLMTSFGAYDVEVILRKKRRGDEDLRGVKKILRSLARRGDASETSAPEKLYVKGVSSGERDEFDLLSNRIQMVYAIRTIAQRSRVLDPVDAYEAIQSAYRESEQEIHQAVSYRVQNLEQQGE